MRRHIITALFLVAPAAGLAAQDTARAQDPQYRTDQQARPQDDRSLVLKLHRGHQMEIRAGQLAQQNGRSEQVKEFGEQLVRDHENANREVTKVAEELNIALPQMKDSAAGHQDMPGGERRDTAQQRPEQQRPEQQPPDYQDPAKQAGADTSEDAKLIERLSGLQGAEFDREFARAMVQSHQKTLRMLQQAQGQVQREEVRELVQNTIPTVQRHLETAQSIARTVATRSGSQN
ncbi:MAG: DUF4142 domain-containing protein [Gemmatimonadales bacterium]